MSSDSSSKPVPAWRPDEAAAPERRSEAGGPVWRQEGQLVPLPPRSRWRLLQVPLALAVLFASTALLIWASLWFWPPEPVGLVLVGADYADNLAIPPNVYGWEGLHGIADLSRTHPLLRLRQQPQKLRKSGTWDSGLDMVTAKTFFIFLALHGGTDRQGAYLLPQDASADDEKENRIRLDQVLDRLAQLPADRSKVLILEPTQIHANWDLGMLHNDFVRELDRLNDRIARIPNLVVLSASDVDQVALASPDWRQTVFTRAIIDGLKGASPDENNDDRISLWELHGYVRGTVERWARDNRDTLQTPALFPRGTVGEQRARAILLLTEASNYRPPDPHALPAFEPPPELLQAWQDRQRLANLSPSPVVYTPQLWRRYQDILLRYEQVLTAGDAAAAGEWQGHLRELGQAIVRQQQLDLSSTQNSLAMPAVAGLVANRSDALQGAFGELWNMALPDAAKRWAQMQVKSGVPGIDDPRLLRMNLCELVLERAADNPTTNLAKARALLQVLRDPIHPPPIEIHYLTMLHRDLPSSPAPPLELVQLALRTRQQAELTALGVVGHRFAPSEQVSPWIQSQVEKADELRRLGEDLVLASDAGHWDRARDYLGQAQKLYQAASADADAVRTALFTRDYVLGTLPYYSQWLARRRRADDQQMQERNDAEFRNVQALWEDTHRLARMLEKRDPLSISRPPAQPEPDEVPPRSLAGQAQQVEAAFRQLERQFTEFCQQLANVDLQSVWRDADDALLVPVIEPRLRMQLLNNQRRISRRFLTETAPRGREKPPVPEDQNRQRVQAIARRQGLMALADLGRRTFDMQGGQVAGLGAEPRQETYTMVEHRLNSFAVEEHWWESLARAGDQVGMRWRQLPRTINRMTDESRTANFEQAQASYRVADSLTRLLDGARAQLLRGDPIGDHRRLMASRLLTWQATRTLADHWYAEDATARPYYAVAGGLYLDDARRLDPRLGPQQEDIISLKKRLELPGELRITGPARLNVTSEQVFGAAYRLEPVAQGTAPPGFPVVWVEPGNKDLQLVKPPDSSRQIRQVGSDLGAAVLDTRLRSPSLQQAESMPPQYPQPQTAALALRGLFRGQRIERVTQVVLYPVADTICTQHPQPATASVAVRASGEVQTRFGAGNGAIAIVLDCSGSMGPPEGGTYGDSTKYVEATRALRQVLRKLPKGVTISVWVFGQATGLRRTVEQAEQTITRVQAPVAWDPANPLQLKELMSKVEYPALEPWNESPIVRTMLMAREDLAKATGFKTLLVLTDGMDNRFDKDLEFNKDKKDIPTVLVQAFQNSGIEINIIGFKVVDAEEAAARKQFEIIRSFPVPGRFYTVNDSQDLAAELERSMRQRLHYGVDSFDNVSIPPSAGVEVSQAGANDQWFPGTLAGGPYKIWTLVARRLERTILLHGGDLLLLQLVAGKQGLDFERVLWSQTDFPDKPAMEKGGWRLAALQNQRLGDRALQMLLTLERVPQAQETILEELKPRAVWFELQPQVSTSTPFNLRWSYRPGFPAPAWSLDVPNWPAVPGTSAPVRPVLRAWWNPDQETPIAAALDRGPDYESFGDLAGKRVQVDGDEVVVESVAIEDHAVETSPGVIESQTCLVVRVKHAQGKPLWVEPRGLKAAGREHRFYTQVGAYTGLFWPVQPGDGTKALAGLRLLSVPAFKRLAEQRGFGTEMKNLKDPDPRDTRPLQPVNLK